MSLHQTTKRDRLMFNRDHTKTLGQLCFRVAGLLDAQYSAKDEAVLANSPCSFLPLCEEFNL